MKQMSKVRTVLFSIALFMSTFAIMWQIYEILIINDLYIAFPSNAAIITGILSWPSLATALASLVAGPMLSKISTKTELIIAGVLMLAGIVPAYVSNVYVLLVCSLLMAFAAGISNTAGMAIISEVFLDEGMRNKMIGWYNSAMTLTSVCISLLGGVLAVNGWQIGFNIYWYVVPMLIMCIIFLPNIKPEDRVSDDEGMVAEAEGGAHAEEQQGKSQKGFGFRFWMFFISVFIFCVAYCPFANYLSVYVSENALGDTDFTGVASAMISVGGFVMGLIFGTLFGKAHRGLNVACYVLPIFVYLGMYLFPSKGMAILGALVYGACYASVFSFLFAYPGYVVPAEKMGTAMGLMTMNYSVANFLGVYLASLLMTSLGGTVTATFPIAAALLVMGLVFELYGFFRDRKDKLYEAPEA